LSGVESNGIGIASMPMISGALLLAPGPTSRDESGFSPISVLILLAVFVVLVVAAAYLGHSMAG
jgi:hypothetical protein